MDVGSQPNSLALGVVSPQPSDLRSLCLRGLTTEQTPALPTFSLAAVTCQDDDDDYWDDAAGFDGGVASQPYEEDLPMRFDDDEPPMQFDDEQPPMQFDDEAADEPRTPLREMTNSEDELFGMDSSPKARRRGNELFGDEEPPPKRRRSESEDELFGNEDLPPGHSPPKTRRRSDSEDELFGNEDSPPKQLRRRIVESDDDNDDDEQEAVDLCSSSSGEETEVIVIDDDDVVDLTDDVEQNAEATTQLDRWRPQDDPIVEDDEPAPAGNADALLIPEFQDTFRSVRWLEATRSSRINFNDFVMDDKALQAGMRKLAAAREKRMANGGARTQRHKKNAGGGKKKKRAVPSGAKKWRPKIPM